MRMLAYICSWSQPEKSMPWHGEMTAGHGRLFPVRTDENTGRANVIARAPA